MLIMHSKGQMCTFDHTVGLSSDLEVTGFFVCLLVFTQFFPQEVQVSWL